MNNILKNITKTLLLAVPLIVLLVPSSLFFPFITGKAFAFRILVELAFGLYAILALINPTYRPKRSLLLICVSVFTLIVLVADIFSPNPMKAFWSNFERMEGFVTIAHLFAYFIVLISVFKERKDWEHFLFTSVGVSVFLSLYTTIQYLGELAIDQGGTRIDGTLGNAAYMAAYFLFHVFFMAFLYRKNFGKLKGIAESVMGGLVAFIGYYLWHISSPQITAHRPGIAVSLIALAIILLIVFVRYISSSEKFKSLFSHFLFYAFIIFETILIYLTATRGALLGLIGGIFISSLYLIFTHKENKSVKKVAMGFVGAVVLLVVVFISVRNIPAVKNDPILGRFASISWGEAQGQARNFIWPMAIKGFEEKPVLGWGQEGFTYIFNKYYNPVMWSQEPWFDRAHNSFLDWLVAAGIFGFLSYLSLYISAVYLLFKKSKFDGIEKGLLFGLISAYAFQNLFIFDNIGSYILFFALLAFIGWSALPEEHKVHRNNEQQIKGNEALIGLIVAITLGVVYFVNWNAYMQNTTLIKAMTIGGLKDGDLVSCEQVVWKKPTPDAKEGANVCLKWSPTLDLFKETLSYNALGQEETRERLLLTSQSIDSQTSIPQDIKLNFFNLSRSEYDKELKEAPLEARNFITIGSYLGSLGMYKDALVYLLKAEELSPKRQQTLFQLGSIYFAMGDKEKSYEILKQAYDEDQTYGEAKIYYAISALQVGKNDEAFAIFNSFALSGDVDQRIIGALVNLKQSDKAISLLQEAISVKPDNKNSYMLLSSVYSSLGNQEKAKAIEVRYSKYLNNGK